MPFTATRKLRLAALTGAASLALSACATIPGANVGRSGADAQYAVGLLTPSFCITYPSRTLFRWQVLFYCMRVVWCVYRSSCGRS